MYLFSLNNVSAKLATQYFPRVGCRWRLPQPARRGVLMHLFGLPQAFGGATPHPTRSLHHLSWDIKTTCTTTIDISKSYHLQYITMASPNYAHSETHLCAAKQPQYLHNVHQAFVTCASMLMLTYSCSSTTAMVKDGVPPSAAIPEVGDVELLKVPPWKYFVHQMMFLIHWTTTNSIMALTLINYVLHYVDTWMLLKSTGMKVAHLSSLESTRTTATIYVNLLQQSLKATSVILLQVDCDPAELSIRIQVISFSIHEHFISMSTSVTYLPKVVL